MSSFGHTSESSVNRARSGFAVSFVTLGCAKNEVDTAHMKRKLRGAGYVLTDDPSEADAVVVNTCSFIQSATEESIDTIFELLELPLLADGDAYLIVAGCMPARYGDALEEELSEARAFVPCSREDDIVDVLDALFESKFDLAIEDEFKPCLYDTPDFASEAFAYVKISDGCDRNCAYCVIPSIRGAYRSFTFDSIRDEVRLRVSEGAREIVLIAQDTGRWGKDFEEKSSLALLLDALSQEFEGIWFRVLYLEPEGVTDDLLDVISRRGNVCSYLDIPLQHVSSKVLKRMNRRGCFEEFSNLFDRIVAKVPDITLRTTLIAGFPGETEDDFDELCEFVEDSPFSYIGVFAYSREEGTIAYDLDGQIDDEEKLYRAQTLRDIADASCSAKIAQRIGTKVRVLIEGCEEDGQVFGRTQSQAPEVDGVTYVDHGEVGEIVEVTIVDTLMYEMEGEQ